MKNLAASIRDRLMNQARASGVPFAALLERFVIGRLLWRLSQSEVSDKFVLKGAQLFALWAGKPHRPTRDLDLLAREMPLLKPCGPCSPACWGQGLIPRTGSSGAKWPQH